MKFYQINIKRKRGGQPKITTDFTIVKASRGRYNEIAASVHYKQVNLYVNGRYLTAYQSVTRMWTQAKGDHLVYNPRLYICVPFQWKFTSFEIKK